MSPPRSANQPGQRASTSSRPPPGSSSHHQICFRTPLVGSFPLARAAVLSPAGILPQNPFLIPRGNGSPEPADDGADAGDTMLVIRDALLLQLQKDRLRQEVIMTELARLERAIALCPAAHHGIGSAYLEQPKPLSFTFNEEFMSRRRWSEHCYDADEVHDPKIKDITHWSVRLNSSKPATKDRFCVCTRPCCSNTKADGVSEAFDEQKLQGSNEVRILSFMHPKKTLPSLKWELTGITIPVKKPKPPQGWSCAICQVEAPNTEHGIQVHCAGKKHRSNVATLESKNKTISQKEETIAKPSPCAGQETSAIKCGSCAICQVEAPNTEHNIQEHCAGKKHRSNVATLESSNKIISQKEETIAEPSSSAGQETSAIKSSCSTCQANCTNEADLKEHLSGRTHQQNIEAQCQEGGGKVKNTELEEAKCHKSNVPPHSEKLPCSISQDHCPSESELGSLLLAKLQDLLDAISNMATISESHKAKFLPNNVSQDAEQISQSDCSICQIGSDYLSCSSEPQSENPHRIRRRRKKRGALQVEGQDAEPGDMEPGDKISSDGSCSKSTGLEEKLAPYLCEVCNLDLNSKSRLADHCNEEEHLEKQKLLTFCKVCNLQCNSSKMLAHHCTGKKHRKNLNANK
ncbi:hypothetical protein HU200_059894 [Digitaria exilis]|uniref:C2H2-type domain-containing protein n=1 Tax=Digitaria exilis TaxID=1010633 RepID=A0A835AB63_9POAL|nr:hypothetical protein HU200_059894 [Digitaria exilis]